MRPARQQLLVKAASLLLACLILGMLTACSKTKEATAVITSALPTTTAPPAPPVVIPATTPKLVTVNITLTVAPGNDYAAYTMPIYLRRTQTLHLNWKAEGSPFQMVATTPSGKVVSVSESGMNTANQPTDLPRVGEIKFYPNDPALNFDWGTDGYFTFVPSIGKGSVTTKITVNYWIQG